MNKVQVVLSLDFVGGTMIKTTHKHKIVITYCYIIIINNNSIWYFMYSIYQPTVQQKSKNSYQIVNY